MRGFYVSWTWYSHEHQASHLVYRAILTATQQMLERSEILPGKGETRCNRTACQCELTIGRRRWNTITRAYCCQSCAFRINENSPLCIRESEKDKNPT